ncbi:MAG: nuclear transport factor 2 family protein [Candidatus Paceibacteria bacterium]
MSQIKTNMQAMLDLVHQGSPIEAIQQYYAEDVEMVQPDGSQIQGKEQIIEHEKAFFSGITEMREFEVYEYLVSGQTSFDFSKMDVTHEQMGEMNMRQASVMEWNEDGYVTRVQFYPES